MAKPRGIYLFVALALLFTGGLPAFAQSLPAGPTSPAPSKSVDAVAETRQILARYGDENNPGSSKVRAAIRDAADATGVDYTYLMAKAQIESRLDPDAKAGSSSATGLFQFIEGTWLSGIEIYGDRYGLGSRVESQLSEDGELLELRHDPLLSALLAAAYTKDHADKLGRVLGREATHSELYLAHFLGSDAAAKFLRAWKRNPHQAAAPLFGRAARANRPIFYARGGQARSLSGVLKLIDVKVRRAAKAATGGAFGRSMASSCDKISVVFQNCNKHFEQTQSDQKWGQSPVVSTTSVSDVRSQKSVTFDGVLKFSSESNSGLERAGVTTSATERGPNAEIPLIQADPPNWLEGLSSHRNVLFHKDGHIDNHTGSRLNRDGRLYKSRNCARSRATCQHFARCE